MRRNVWRAGRRVNQNDRRVNQNDRWIRRRIDGRTMAEPCGREMWQNGWKEDKMMWERKERLERWKERWTDVWPEATDRKHEEKQARSGFVMIAAMTFMRVRSPHLVTDTWTYIWKDGRTYGRADGWTEPLIEMLRRIWKRDWNTFHKREIYVNFLVIIEHWISIFISMSLIRTSPSIKFPIISSIKFPIIQKH